MKDSAEVEQHSLPEDERSAGSMVAGGISVAAAILLLTLGALSTLEGLAALLDDELYVAGINYVYKFDTTAWGWIHMVLGIVACISAVGLMFGTLWGRYAAMVIASLVIIANFLSLPYYPAWTILIISLSVVVIWAASTWQPEH